MAIFTLVGLAIAILIPLYEVVSFVFQARDSIVLPYRREKLPLVTISISTIVGTAILVAGRMAT